MEEKNLVEEGMRLSFLVPALEGEGEESRLTHQLASISAKGVGSCWGEEMMAHQLCMYVCMYVCML